MQATGGARSQIGVFESRQIALRAPATREPDNRFQEAHPIMEQQGLATTPLHSIHRDLGGRMVGFAGWEMPVQYSGIIEEHMAVRTAAGLFDVSHMGEVELRGGGAAAAVQLLTCNDVSVLTPGRAQYSALLNEKAGVLDDVIVYCRADDSYLIVVNAANAKADFEWIRDHAGEGVDVVDRSQEFGLLALQGPRALEILSGVATGAALESVVSFGAVDIEIAGAACMAGRTGYTGEDGFEILVPEARTVDVWSALMQAGASAGMIPAGLAARDTLRLEAGLLLHGSDMDSSTTPLEAGLAFIVKLEAGEFLGRDVLRRQQAEGVTRRQRGLEMVDRGIARAGHEVWAGGSACGRVTSGSYVPFLKKNIARAWLPTEESKLGAEVEVAVRNRRIRARVVKTPFYRRPRPTGAGQG